MLQDYLAESAELLERAQGDLLRLESSPQNGEVLASIFRAFHTMKGTAQHIGAASLVDWTHDLENLLDRLRSGVLPLTSSRVEAILQGLDVVREMVQSVARQKSPSPGPVELGERIRELARAESDDAALKAVPVAHNCATEPHVKPFEVTGSRQQPEAADAGDSCPQPGTVVVSSGLYTSTQADQRETISGNRVAARAEGQDAAGKSIRIDAPRLDAVMNQVGELVLLRNRLASAVAALSDENENLVRIAREMDLTVNDLQTTVMRLRMQPCRRLFQQLPRVVHDISKQLGKEVKLEIEGGDVEIDKSIIDALSGSMTHLVRNSLDHGIEAPYMRVAAGKLRVATIRVMAVHLGDKVRIEVSDDGKGIDSRFVVQKAIAKGVVTVEQAARLSEQEALELIFRPGFSTKDEASNLSGRGVGMDVVKETAVRLRGRLSIDTSPGRGTIIAMEFPLTLAVLPVLYVRLREDVYALPVSSIESLTDIEPSRVHTVAGCAAYRVDDTRQTVPVVDLGMILEGKPLRAGRENVEGVLTERGLFVVSEVLGNEDSVVKPIDFLTGQNWYQGATISGRGSVVLILDAGALSAAAENQGAA